MVGAANSDSARISFFGSTKGELAQKWDGGQDAIGPPAADSSAPRTARNGRLLHGSLTLPGVGVPIIRRRSGAPLLYKAASQLPYLFEYFMPKVAIR